MDAVLIVTTVTTILVALIGYLATYVNNVRIAQRAERLNRTNKQLNEFYGPLYALSQANEIAWQKFREETIHTGRFLASQIHLQKKN